MDTAAFERALSLHQHAFANDNIAAEIRAGILSHALAPGRRLPSEHELAAIFRVSRATIREALRTLAAEQLVITRKGVTGGSFVAEPSVAKLSERLGVGIRLLTAAAPLTLHDFMELRFLLEVPAAEMAASRKSPEELEELELNCSTDREVVGDRTTYLENRDFHFSLMSICHNPLMTLAAEPVFLVLQTCLDRRGLDSDFHETVTLQHREIVTAITDGDGDAASGLMREHLDWLTPRYQAVWRPPGPVA